MTIQEAIKSGKPFRRTLHDKWYFATPSGNIMCESGEEIAVAGFMTGDILADDWEVQK